MRDIPVFTTENGIASLFLRNIPFSKKAYIKIQSTQEPEVFQKECADFCRAVGAVNVFVTGIDAPVGVVSSERIVLMSRSREGLPDTDAMLFPVQEETLEKWREIYNQKMHNVPNAALISYVEAKKYLNSGSCYFVHNAGQLLGIGVADGNRIEALASVKKGAGNDVLLALAKALSGECIVLSVAEGNHKAVQLYQSLGFITSSVEECWYQIF